MKVEITRVDPSLPLPAYGTGGAAGFDFYCRETMEIAPGAIVLVPANAIVRVPDGHVLIVALRSSTPRRLGLVMANGIGIIDSDYCGPEDEIKIQVQNVRDTAAVVRRGDRIAQGLLVPVVRCEWDEVDARTRRTRGGFGSTG